MPTLPAVSREYLYFPGIQAFDVRSPDSAVDPATLTAQVAFVKPGVSPIEADWVAAQWQDITTVRVIVGAGSSNALPIGEYAVWLRVVGAVEQPERNVGTLGITK